MPKTEAPPARWRDWTTADRDTHPRRTCSVAGCREVPARAKETETQSGKTRTHAYCKTHAAEYGG